MNQSPPLPKISTPPPQDVGASILVVDDDAMVREATAWMLTGAGYHVTEAVDGLDALDHMTRQGPPDLVITDINMPRMTGLALIERARQYWPSVPFLIVSGRAQPPGTPDYMLKPFAGEALMQAIRRALHSLDASRSQH
jgi:two-component system chemotaxis response regulator CheY